MLAHTHTRLRLKLSSRINDKTVKPRSEIARSNTLITRGAVTCYCILLYHKDKHKTRKGVDEYVYTGRDVVGRERVPTLFSK